MTDPFEGLRSAAVDNLDKSKTLRRKCHRLASYLNLLQLEDAHSASAALDLEIALSRIVDASASLALKRKGRLKDLSTFYNSFRAANELDEYHFRLVEIVERERSNGKKKQRNVEQVEAVLEQLFQDQKQDRKVDLASSRAAVDSFFRSDLGVSDEDLRLLGSEFRVMKSKKLVNVMLSPDSSIHSVMQQVCSRSHVEECALQADISLEHFAIEESICLGTGSFGKVLGGRYQKKKVAVKSLVGMEKWSCEAQELFRFRVEQWKKLEHENVARLVGTAMVGNTFHLVIEKYRTSLHDWLYKKTRSNSTGPETFRSIAHGIANGLAYLHGLGILHQDLKPTNILFASNSGKVRLSGFGINLAKRDFGNGLPAEEKKGAALIDVYTAPEVESDRASATSRSDVYSLGMVLWELFHEKSPSSFFEMIQKGERPPFSNSTSKVALYEQLVQSCWDQDPLKRPTCYAVAASFKDSKQRASIGTILRRSFGRGNKSGMSLLQRELRSEFGVDKGKQDRKGLIRGSLSRAVSLAPSNPFEDQKGKFRRFVRDLHDQKSFKRSVRGMLKLVQHSGTEDLRRIGWELDAIAEILDRLDTRANSPPSFFAECFLTVMYMMNFPGNEECLKEVGEKLPVIMNQMRSFLAHANVQASGCLILFLAAQMPTNLQIFEKNGAASLLFDILKQHGSDIQVTRHVFEVLGLLSGFQGGSAVLSEPQLHQWILRFMDGENIDSSMQSNAWKVLKVLPREKFEDLLLSLGGVQRILLIVEKAKGCAELRAAAWRAIVNVAKKGDSSLNELMVDRLLPLMTTNTTDTAIQEICLEAIYSASIQTGRGEEFVSKPRMIEQIVDSMRHHPQSTSVQIFGCNSLSLLLFSDRDVLTRFTNSQGPFWVIEAMKSYPKDREVQVAGCSVLVALRGKITFDVLNQEFIKKQVLAVMESFPSDASVQEKTCAVLSFLAIMPQTGQEILESGAAKELLTIMDRFLSPEGGNALVLLHCSEALLRLALHDQNRAALIQLDAIGRLKAVMSVFPADLPLQSVCFSALVRFAQLEEGPDLLMKIGVLEGIVAVMRAHSHCAELQVQGSRVLKYLATTPEYCNKLVDSGAAERVITLMGRNAEDMETQLVGCGVLLNLAASNTLSERLLKMDSAKRIITAMEVHSESGDVQELACGALWNLGGTEYARAELFKLSAVKCIFMAMDDHQKSISVSVNACGAIWNLAAGKKWGDEDYTQVQAAGRIVRAMEEFPSSAELQHQAFGALYNLSVDSSVARQLRKNGVVELAKMAKVSFMDHSEVKKWANKLLKQLE